MKNQKSLLIIIFLTFCILLQANAGAAFPCLAEVDAEREAEVFQIREYENKNITHDLFGDILQAYFLNGFPLFSHQLFLIDPFYPLSLSLSSRKTFNHSPPPSY